MFGMTSRLRLSDRSPPSNSLEAWVEDLDAVVKAQGLKKFQLFGMSQGGAIAIVYAARLPERVHHLVLFGAYAKGMLRREVSDQVHEEAETLSSSFGWVWDATTPFRRSSRRNSFPTERASSISVQRPRARLASPSRCFHCQALYQIDVSKEAASLNVPTWSCILGTAPVPFE